jgi:acetyltransferase-like isoleucine patch superfamily enzyme
MNPNYTDKPIDEFLFRLYRIKSRYSRKIIRELLLRRKNSEIYSRVLRKIFSQYHYIHIGMYSYGAFTLSIPSGTVVGRYSSVPRNLLVLRGNYAITRKSCHPFFFNPTFHYVDKLLITRRKLTIGNDAYVGIDVTILPSVSTIGNGAVVGAGSVVVRDVPPFAVVGGNPAKIIKYRFSQNTIDEITKSAWWEKDIEELKKDEQDFASFLHPLE